MIFLSFIYFSNYLIINYIYSLFSLIFSPHILHKNYESFNFIFKNIFIFFFHLFSSHLNYTHDTGIILREISQ